MVCYYIEIQVYLGKIYNAKYNDYHTYIHIYSFTLFHFVLEDFPSFFAIVHIYERTHAFENFSGYLLSEPYTTCMVLVHAY